MALGKIKADTLEHSTAGSLDTKFVVNGSAKAWVNLSNATAITASLNISSAVDNSTGYYTAVMTNSFSGSGKDVATGSGGVSVSSSQDRTVAFFPASTTNQIELMLRVGSTATDLRGGGSVFGDLA